MDILIKGMEMPSKCFDCGFCYDGDRIRYCLATPWQKEIRKEVFPKRREDFCPLVALPEPHGRIVDISRVENFLTKWENGELDYEPPLDEILSMIRYSTKTIVEATE